MTIHLRCISKGCGKNRKGSPKPCDRKDRQRDGIQNGIKGGEYGNVENRDIWIPASVSAAIILAVTLAAAVIISPEAAGAAAFMGICLFALFMGTAFSGKSPYGSFRKNWTGSFMAKKDLRFHISGKEIWKSFGTKLPK